MVRLRHRAVLAGVAGGIKLLEGGGSKSTDWDHDTVVVVYDLIAIVTFVIMVFVPFVLTILAKMLKLKRLMSRSLEQANEETGTPH